MNLPRIFASAIARRTAYVVVAALLAWAGLGDAKAQVAVNSCYNAANWGSTSSPEPCVSRQIAYSQLQAAASNFCSTYTCRFTQVQISSTQCAASVSYCTVAGKVRYKQSEQWDADYVFYRHWPKNSECPEGKVWNSKANSCQSPCNGSSFPPTTVQRSPLSGSLGCSNGCVFNFANNGDDTSTVTTTGAMCGPDFKNECPSSSVWNGAAQVCQPKDPTCPAGQVKKDGVCVPEDKCPDGMIASQGSTPGAVQSGELFCKPKADECPAGTIKAPASGKCIPGDGQCAVGEARRDNGTCGKDSDGDGKPDEDDEDPNNDPDKDSASGGDSCDAPPSCSGNAIQCMQVKVLWRVDCNTRKTKNVAGGSCDATPVCTGKDCDAMEYASLIQQWKAACALDKLAKKGAGDEGNSADGNGNGVPDALEGTGDVADVGDSAADVAGAKNFGIGVSTSLLSQDNIFGSGSCPSPPSFRYMGVSVSGSDFPYWCQAMAILRGLILIFGAFTALKILMGWGF